MSHRETVSPWEIVNPPETVNALAPSWTVFQVDGFLPGEDPRETVNPRKPSTPGKHPTAGKPSTPRGPG